MPNKLTETETETVDVDGATATVVHLQSETLRASVASYGARLISLMAPDRDSALVDVVLSSPSIADSPRDDAYLGATVGRFANRIRRGAFALDGHSLEVGVNEGLNHLHGGPGAFDRRNCRSSATISS